MVKTDLKHNYYADLELPPSASLEDVRKAYRKLALQYHPDRNAGREDECVPKFQAIQAANEVLGEPLSKQKYDIDRRKIDLHPLGQTFNPRQPASGNPYAANSAYPPPPRRTQPGMYQRPAPPTPGPAPGANANGADRFSNFPRPSPTARKDPAQDRTNMFKAWQNMNNPQDRQRNFVPPGSQPPPQPQPHGAQPRPTVRPQPPPRQETKFPPEDQTRAGTKYRNVPPPFDAAEAEKKQSAWAAFQQANAGKPGMTGSTSAKTPRKQGFNPNMPGSDEKGADANYFHRNRSEALGRGKPTVNVQPPPSAPRASATATTPVSPVSPRSHRPAPDPTRPFSSRTPNDQVPFTEGSRDRTPYTSFLRERTDIGGGLHRSFSTRDTTKLGPEDSTGRSRARSTSPLGRHRADDSQAHEHSKKHSFDLGYSSSETSDSDPSRNQTPADVNHSSASESTQRPGTAPNTATPFERPKKVPTPPSSRFNGTRSDPTSPPPMPKMPYTNGAADSAQSHTGHPSMQQKSKPNMYAYLSSSSPLNPAPSISSASGSNSTWRPRRKWSNLGPWAIPSSLQPFVETPEPSTSYVTAADEVFTNATRDEQKAYLCFQSALSKKFDYVPDNLDMEVFLKLASTARQGTSCGNASVDASMKQILHDFHTVGYAQNNMTDHGSCASSFAFPPDNDLFTTTNAKSRSAENINTQFSPEGWNGTFTGEPDYFAPPPSTGRKVSPSRRTNTSSSRTPRSATMDEPSPSVLREEVPQRPWGSDGTPRAFTPDATPAEVRFSQDEWKKTFQDGSWTWKPESQSTNTSAGQSRKQSQSRKASKSANRSTPGTRHQPHVVDEGDDLDFIGADGRPAKGGPVGQDFDPMDIDNTPPGPVQQDSTTDKEKEARLYSVPKSAWREEQEQKQSKGHRISSSASRRAARASLTDGANLNANLDDLRNVEPISKTANGGAGLQDLGNMGFDLPYESQAASSVNPKLLVPQHLDLPHVPTPPEGPRRLSKASWHEYAQSFGDYLRAFHGFNNVMLRHFATRESLVESRFVNGTAWLTASGDTSGVMSQPSGFGSYLAAVKEDEKVREAWNVGCDKHADAVKAFEKMRERVRRLAAGGSLVDN